MNIYHQEDKPDEYSGRQSDIYVVFGLESEIMRKNMQSVSHFITLAHLFVLWLEYLFSF